MKKKSNLPPIRPSESHPVRTNSRMLPTPPIPKIFQDRGIFSKSAAKNKNYQKNPTAQQNIPPSDSEFREDFSAKSLRISLHPPGAKTFDKRHRALRQILQPRNKSRQNSPCIFGKGSLIFPLLLFNPTKLVIIGNFILDPLAFFTNFW